MKRMFKTGAAALTVLAGLGAFTGGAVADTYKVTIYNLTQGQILSPPVVAAHSRSVSVFSPGEPATEGLHKLAEDALTAILVGELEYAGAKVEIGAGGIPPGEHIDVYIKTSRRNRLISVVGMLVTTNDAFYGLGGARADGDSGSYYVPAWDAGTEVNDEKCAHIPGPPCNDPDEQGVEEEGFVHIHNGIHGLAIVTPREEGVNPETHDWRNPVAKIVISRVDRHRSKRDRDDDDDDDDD